MLQKLKLLINIFLFLFLSKNNSYKINLKHSFLCYSNTLHEVVTMNSNELVVEIDVFIPLGKNEKTLKPEKNFIELDVSHLDHGIYFMNVTINSNMYVFKISNHVFYKTKKAFLWDAFFEKL